MSGRVFVAIHHSMSVEDPEQGTPPEVFAVSPDKDRLIDKIKTELEEQVADDLEANGDVDDVAAPVLVEEEGDEILIKACYTWSGGEYATYYVIESAPLI